MSNQPDKPLAGRVAYVTGAARGQGREYAIRLAKDGADIVATDACEKSSPYIQYPTGTTEDLDQTVAAVKELGREIIAERVDVRDLSGQQKVVGEAINRFGRLDVVVANAGIAYWARLWELEPDQWRDVIDVNLTGVWNTIKAAVPAMIEAGNGGSIITISSSAGIKAVPGCGHYSAAKFGVVGLTNSLAIELGEYGIRANSVHPWATNTALAEDRTMVPILEQHPTFLSSFAPSLYDNDRLIEPTEIAEVVAWLAGDASGVMTGAQVPVDKGVPQAMTACPFAPGFDFTDPDLIQQRIPIEEFAYLRKTEPIWWNAQPRGVAGFDDYGYWVVTKHADVKEVSRLSDVFSNSANTTVVRYNEDITPEQLDIQRENLLIDMDEPKHRVLRRIVSPLFTPKAVNGLHERLVTRAHGIVEAAAEKSSGNFVSDIASVLPMHAIADLVGIPEADRHQVLDWTNQMFAYDDPAIGKDTATTATVSMLGYAYAMAEERQLNPRDDILTGLVQGAYEDRPLTPLEFAYFVIQLMVAGNETSRNAITHGVLAFADNPAQWELYRERRPQTTADEIIRWASPIIAFQRTALRDVELGGVRIHEGQRVGMFYASANFDEEVFDDPFTFNIERDPNPHLAFGGHGIHYCLGANLARLEIGIMFDAMADRLPDLMPTGEPTRFRSGWINGVVSLPATYVS